jgi:hypothetical protein
MLCALSDDIVCHVIACVLRTPDLAAVRAVFRAFGLSSKRTRGLLHTRVRARFTGPYFSFDALVAPESEESVCRDFRLLPNIRTVVVSAGAHISEPPLSCYRRVELGHPIVPTLLRCAGLDLQWTHGVRDLRLDYSWLGSCGEIGLFTGLVRLALVGCRCHTTAGLTVLADLRSLTIDALVFYSTYVGIERRSIPMLPTTQSLAIERLAALDTLTLRRMPARALCGLVACSSLRSLTVESLYTNTGWSMARPDDVEPLRHITQLTRLRVYNLPTSAWLYLAELTNLTVVSYSGFESNGLSVPVAADVLSAHCAAAASLSSRMTRLQCA